MFIDLRNDNKKVGARKCASEVCVASCHFERAQKSHDERKSYISDNMATGQTLISYLALLMIKNDFIRLIFIVKKAKSLQ